MGPISRKAMQPKNIIIFLYYCHYKHHAPVVPYPVVLSLPMVGIYSSKKDEMDDHFGPSPFRALIIGEKLTPRENC